MGGGGGGGESRGTIFGHLWSVQSSACLQSRGGCWHDLHMLSLRFHPPPPAIQMRREKADPRDTGRVISAGQLPAPPGDPRENRAVAWSSTAPTVCPGRLGTKVFRGETEPEATC